MRSGNDKGQKMKYKAGDIAHFTYGIPPISVDAPIIERDGKFIMLTPGHNPEESELNEALILDLQIEIREK